MLDPAVGFFSKGRMADVAAIILERSNRWMQAWMEQDRAALEQYLAPDYALVISIAPLQRIEGANWLDTAVGPYVCTRFAYEAVQVRQLGEGFAVMSAIADFDATIAGVDRSGRYFVTDVWRLEGDGEWRVCARYSSHPEPAGASAQVMERLAR